MLKKPKTTKYYLVKIKFKKPEGVVFRTIEATKYREFRKNYTKKALLKGLKISEIKLEKKFT